MDTIDRILDSTLIGFTRLGFAARDCDLTEHFPSLLGKHIVVSGATGGIGRAATERLAHNGATVHAIGRSQDKLDILSEEVPGVVTHRADLSLMSEIRDVASRILDSVDTIHGLVNNVGVMTHEWKTTDEGFELTYATNLLGQYVLTTELEPAYATDARILFISSGGMYSQPLQVDRLESPEQDHDGTAAYARTKRAQVVLADHLNTAFEDDRVVASMHPGWVDTDGVSSSLPTFQRIMGPFLRTPEQGADTIVWFLGAAEADSTGGAFLHDREPRRQHRLKRTTAGDGADGLITRLAHDARTEDTQRAEGR